MSFQALWKLSPSGCSSVIARNPSPSSCLAHELRHRLLCLLLVSGQKDIERLACHLTFN
jgi:hypothetical protein